VSFVKQEVDVDHAAPDPEGAADGMPADGLTENENELLTENENEIQRLAAGPVTRPR